MGRREREKGLQTVVEMLAGLDPPHRIRLIRNVSARDPELAKAIRERLFGFEQLAQIAPTPRQLILNRIPVENLALALRALPETVSKVMFEALTARKATEVREEMLHQGPRRLSDVEKARAEILRLAKSWMPELFGE